MRSDIDRVQGQREGGENWGLEIQDGGKERRK